MFFQESDERSCQDNITDLPELTDQDFVRTKVGYRFHGNQRIFQGDKAVSGTL
jgi:hypothetical protein